MKFKSSFLVVMIVLLFTPSILEAQCLDFDISKIPVDFVFDAFHPMGTPYMQVPTIMNIGNLSLIPLPTTGNSPYGRQAFCDLWELFFPGSGIFVRVYVPTVSERMGDYSALLTGRVLGTDAIGGPIMEGAIYDPFTERYILMNGSLVRVVDPFPGNIIPVARWGNPFIWLTSGFVTPTAQDTTYLLINDVEAQLESGTLTQNQADGLTIKLNEIVAKLEAGNKKSACNQLNAFINQVQAFVNAGTLSPEEGQALIDKAESIENKAGC